MRKQGTEKLKVQYKQLRREIQRQLRRAYWAYLNTTFEDADSEQATKSKCLWTYIKHQKSSNVGLSRPATEGRRTPYFGPQRTGWNTQQAVPVGVQRREGIHQRRVPWEVQYALQRLPYSWQDHHQCTRCEKTALQPQRWQSSWPGQHQPSCLERTNRGGSSHPDTHLPVISRHWLVTSGLERRTRDTCVEKKGNSMIPLTVDQCRWLVYAARCGSTSWLVPSWTI